MPELILHHFDPSPFAEKIRLVFGLKGLAWRSVDIPMVPPKPDLTALTGGYRRTPVLQVGADVFCDTRTILRELDRRVPSPPLIRAETAGVSVAFESWAERDLFWNMVRTPEAKRDMKAVKAAATNSAVCWAILEARLADGRPFIEGAAFTLADIVLGCFARRWFGPEVRVPGMPEFPNLTAWYARLGERPGFQKWVAPPLF
jgi:glutathione S-transferase